MPSTRKKKCRYCGTWFYPAPQAGPRQKQCGAPACKKQRIKESQNRWHRQKAPCYFHDRYNHMLKPWLEAHPGYLPGYRATHPEHVTRNRQQQKERDRKRQKSDLDIQDSAFLQSKSDQRDAYKLSNLDIQDALTPYPELFSGLMSQLRDLDIQDTIDISLAGVYNRGRFLKRLCERTSHAETRCGGQTDP